MEKVNQFCYEEWRIAELTLYIQHAISVTPRGF